MTQPIPHGFNRPSNLHRSAGQMMVMYFLRSGPLTKVGITDDLPRRMREFKLHNPQAGEPSWVAIPRCLARQVEKRVHEAMKAKARGREWFSVDRTEARKFAAPIIRQAEEAARVIEDDYFKQAA